MKTIPISARISQEIYDAIAKRAQETDCSFNKILSRLLEDQLGLERYVKQYKNASKQKESNHD